MAVCVLVNHLKALRVFNFVQGGLSAFAGLVFLFLFLLPSFIDLGEDVPIWLFAVLGVVGFILFEAFAVAHVLVGFLVTSGRGRILQTVLALSQVLSFPIGTVYGAYALWICWIHEPTKKRFDAVFHPPVT